MSHEAIIETDVQSYSSRKLWDLLLGHDSDTPNAAFANAAREELYRRGDFRPRGLSPMPF